MVKLFFYTFYLKFKGIPNISGFTVIDDFNYFIVCGKMLMDLF